MGFSQDHGVQTHSHGITGYAFGTGSVGGFPFTHYAQPGAYTTVGYSTANSGGTEPRPYNVAVLYCIRF